MNERLKTRMSGLRASMKEFTHDLCGSVMQPDLQFLTRCTEQELKKLNYDSVMTDEMNNIIGIIKGYKNEGSIVVLSTIDLEPAGEHEGMIDLSKGQNSMLHSVAGLYTGALLKRSIAALTGELIYCCIPRHNLCSFGIQYLFQTTLRDKKIKGVILTESTDMNIFTGSKGHMEYEIVVQGDFNNTVLANNGSNMLSTMYPLVKELEDVSRNLPKNYDMGDSELKIKDISYKSSNLRNEFHVLVDRTFTQEENIQSILNRAKGIAARVFSDKPATKVNAMLTQSRVGVAEKKDLVLKNHYIPWRIESHTPFIYSSLNALKESSIAVEIGCWKKNITEGSFTCGELKIPTFGFGIGEEGSCLSINKNVRFEDLEKSVYAMALMIYRNIGFPTFGWDDDEI